MTYPEGWPKRRNAHDRTLVVPLSDAERLREEAEMWRESARVNTDRALASLARVRELGDYEFDPDYPERGE